MDYQSYKTVSANAQTVAKEWVVIDATDQVLGRLASRVALVLRGKNKANYTPHVDCGDNVIAVSYNKLTRQATFRYTHLVLPRIFSHIDTNLF